MVVTQGDRAGLYYVARGLPVFRLMAHCIRGVADRFYFESMDT